MASGAGHLLACSMISLKSFGCPGLRSMLTRQYRSLYFVKALMNQGYGKKEIASKAGLHPFVVGKSMVQCKRFRMGQLRQSMEEGAGLEQAVKTGTLSENLAVELFIVKQSEKR